MAFFRSGHVFAGPQREGFLSGTGSDRLFSRGSIHDYSELPTREPSEHVPTRRHTTNVADACPRHDIDGDDIDEEEDRRHTISILERTYTIKEENKALAEAKIEPDQKRVVPVLSDHDHATEKPFFQSFIGIVIVINSLLMGMEIDYPWCGWRYLEHALLCIYVFELYVRMKNFGRLFFSCHNEDVVWNLLDFTIVISSVLDLWIIPLGGEIMKFGSSESETLRKEEHKMSFGKVMMLMRMLRLMRILRLAKLVKSVRPLFILVTGVMAALQGVAWVLVLTTVTLYAMGILSTSLIGKKMVFPPNTDIPDAAVAPFKTVPDSMFTLFRIMSGAASDSDIVAIDTVIGDVPPLKLVFVLYMITTSWTLLSILTAVVSDNMISTTAQHEEEHKIAKEEDDRMHHVQRLKEVFNSISVRGDGQVEKHEIEVFLSDEHNAALTAACCRVPVRDVREVLQSVCEACTGSTVSLEDFVEHLADVSHVVTEKSMMKIEAKLINLSRHQLEQTKELHQMFMSWQEKSMSRGMLEPEMGAVSSSNSMQNGAEKVCKESSTDSMSKPENVAASGSKATQNEAEVACKDQLNKLEKRMEEIGQRIEVCLKEVELKNQRLDASMTEALEQAMTKSGIDKLSEMLELRLSRMQHELLGKLVWAPDIIKARDGQEAAELTAINTIADQDTYALQNQTDVAELACASDGGAADMKLSDSQMVARLLEAEESIRGLLQKTDSTLFKREGLVLMIVQGLSAHVSDKLSETLEHELRTLRQESLELLRIIGKQEPESSKLRDGLQKESRQAASNATGVGSKEEIVSTPMNSTVDGNIGSSPRATTEPRN